MTDTKKRILDAAEALFAERGFDATSMRAITAAAGVNLAAVNYHFGSKEALLRAIVAERLGTINERRLAMLDEGEAEAGDRPVPLEKVLRAFVEPVLRLGGDPAAGGTGFGILLGRMYSWPSSQMQRVLVSEMKGTVERFRNAFRRAAPDLPPTELYWRIGLSIGAMAFTLAAAGLLRAISDGLCDPSDKDETVERVMAFVLGGLRAPVSSGLGERQGKRRRAVTDGPAAGTTAGSSRR